MDLEEVALGVWSASGCGEEVARACRRPDGGGPDAIPAGYHWIGDLDLDGRPEVVVVSPSATFAEPMSGQPHVLSLLRADPDAPSGVAVLRKAIDLNATEPPLSPFGGGPPIIADFDADGFPDVGTATSSAYVVLSGAKLMDMAVADADNHRP